MKIAVLYMNTYYLLKSTIERRVLLLSYLILLNSSCNSVQYGRVFPETTIRKRCLQTFVDVSRYIYAQYFT